ncbi:MAG: 2-amino-4-hydroxy-6-hydroxymethyldihydropteridine diphosphokinase [Desulfobacterales bacterium]|nr:2-amino-4-hydroxy-6-hydroxymethyldihydropteridine diphosphokinase [Desulfobacterales bacterium]
MRHIAYIGVGSNIGDKAHRCEQGIAEILRIDRTKLLAKSSLYKTQPVGHLPQDWFVNGVIKIETDLEAPDLFRSMKEIETRLGRRKTFRWGPRTLDLDLLLFDDQIIDTEELSVPHPRIQERQFVLIPLAEIDRYLIHPVLRKSVQELLENLKQDQGVEKLNIRED